MQLFQCSHVENSELRKMSMKNEGKFRQLAIFYYRRENRNSKFSQLQKINFLFLSFVLTFA